MQNGFSSTLDYDCFPPSFSVYGRAVVSEGLVYSPGACPEGYTTAFNGADGATSEAVCCLTYAPHFPLVHCPKVALRPG